jgi:hypothetical protein
MRKVFISILLASVVTAPVGAANWQDQAMDSRPGAFLGARLKLPLGQQAAAKPRAELAFAPTQSRVSSSGLVRTRIGEGLGFGLAPHSKPTLTVAGMRADAALGFARSGRAKTDQKLGLGTGGWIAVGVGTVVSVGVIGLALWADHVSDCERRENGCN